MIEILLFLLKGYLSVGVMLGILALFTTMSSGFKEFLREEYPDEDWGWKSDVTVVLEAVFLWPLAMYSIYRRMKDD